MKRLLSYLLSAMLLLVVGCAEEFDDSKIWDKLNSLENRVTALEQLCKQMNTNISSLQKIVEALQNNDYVTNVAPITEDGKVVGYVITFSKSGSITIYHGKDGANGTNGKDGADGYTPVIGVAKDSDGVYYWTLDGDWLLDQDGNKVKAEGKDGKNGADGTTPKLKIESVYWYISYDNGTTWTELGKATGEDGDSMFKEVTYDDEYVYITLTDGSTITIPYHLITPPNNEVWYIASQQINISSSVITYHTFNPLSHKGIIGLKEHKIEIGNRPIGSTPIGSTLDFPESADSTVYSIILPNSIVRINTHAFAGCKTLKSINIPNSVEFIGERAFYDCDALESIHIPSSVKTIEDYAFSKCDNLTSAIIDSKHIYGAEGIFQDCKSLKYVTLTNDIYSIPSSAFERCSSLTSITLPEELTWIERFAFRDCNLHSIILPKKLGFIGSAAFLGNNIVEIYCKPEYPMDCTCGLEVPDWSDVGYYAHCYIPFPKNCVIYVPEKSLNLYKHYWSWEEHYKDVLVGYDFDNTPTI